MRPVVLTMKAFGSFAKETVVRFADFPSGLYLIVGETGSGKTTIFDAIVFALFGAASGSNRKPDMMHSDYVEKSMDTEVSLTFEQSGRQYTVTRTIHFRKKRGRENEYSEGTLDAVLTQPEEPAVKGHTAVTKRCEELLGLNAEQFRKIVMLAQGEFREFLAADAVKKSEILGRLFDSSEYIRYQNLLQFSRTALAEKRKQARDRVETVMTTVFQLPEDGDALYLPGDPHLVEHLDSLLESDQEKAGDLSNKKTAAQKVVDDINTAIGAADVNNQKLEELAGFQKHRQELEQRREEMDLLMKEYFLAEKAWRRVCPAREKWQAEKTAAEKAREEIDRLREQVSSLSEKRDQAQRMVRGDEESERRIQTICTEIQMIAESFPQYAVLEEKLVRRDETSAAVETAKASLADAEKRKQEGEGTLNQLRDELAALEYADAEAVRTEAAYMKAKADSVEWSGDGGVLHGVKGLGLQEDVLHTEEKVLTALAKKAGDAEGRYHQAYQAFISGQAGLLAREMERELNETGSAICPVCRSSFQRGKEHAFAPYVEGTPTQEKVNKAKELFEKSEKKRSDQSGKVDKLRVELASQKESLLARAQKLLPDCENWDQLAGEAYLTAAGARFDQAEAESGDAYRQAERKLSRKAELKKQDEDLMQSLETAAEEIRQATAALREAETGIAVLEAEIQSLRETLPCETREDAEIKRTGLERERDERKERIDANRTALEEAKQKLDRAQGDLSAREEALPAQEHTETEARGTFETTLAANGFVSASALEDALAPMGENDREDWLAARQKGIDDYRNDCENTRKRLEALSKQTEGLQYIDLEELRRELDAAGEERNAAEQECAAQNERLRNHTEVRRRIAGALDELARTDGAWERLDRLAELAMGAAGEGGKLSFERYVMGSIFREVLDMANRRLDIMSGGRYSLVHTTNAGRSNAVAGLEIEVLDVATGKQRPANSLSGGETFQVSLSLALGLSDVVQSRAGGIGLDTIFIDEGFGALDSGALDNAITVLNQLTEGNRLVGIISHVDKLEESIPQKLRVKKTAHGSELKSELS